MVGHHHEHRPAAGAEGLGQRRAAGALERTFGDGRRLAHRFEPAAAVDDAHADGVAARAFARIHEAPVGVRAGGVERVHELRQRRVGPVAVVLQLHQRGQVRVQRLHRGHQLGHLARVLGRRGGAAVGREAAALAVAVEQVQHVEAGDAAVAGHGGRGGARRLFDAAQGFGELQAEAAEALVQHALHARDHAARAQRRGVVPVAGQEPQVLRVLAAARVVQPQRQPGVLVRHGLRPGAGRRHFGGRIQPAAEAGEQLAVARQAVVAGDGERRGDGQQLTLQAFPAGGRGRRLREHARRGLAAAGHFHRRRVQRRQRLVVFALFQHRAGEAHAVAHAQPGLGIGAAQDEQALGRGRVAVFGFGLDENAAQVLGEVRHHDAFHGDLPAFQRAARAAALYLADGLQAIGQGGRRGVLRRGFAAGQQQGRSDQKAAAHGDSGQDERGVRNNDAARRRRRKRARAQLT